jgi:hypothetical protein
MQALAHLASVVTASRAVEISELLISHCMSLNYGLLRRGYPLLLKTV